MPYFVGSASIFGKQVAKAIVKGSDINTSTIDMDMNKITSVGDPTHPQDAATQAYVLRSMEKISKEIENLNSGVLVTLTGTTYSKVSYLKAGSCIVTVTPISDGFPTAIFSISKASVYSGGAVVRVTSEPGTLTPEQLDLRWDDDGFLILRKTGPGYDGEYLVEMTAKNPSAVNGPPVVASDIATMAYVDKIVREQLSIKLGGIQIALNGTTPSPIVNLRSGSYIAAVSPLNMEGAPTSTFHFSKNSIASDAVIMTDTYCLGDYTLEKLELIWPANELPQLRKSGAGYDGLYLFDMILKNVSDTAQVPSIPTDVATLEFVTAEIDRRLKAKFGGDVVTLTNAEYQNVRNLRPGSYHITVTSLVPNGPCATFSVSKNSPYIEACIIRSSSCPGIDSGEVLDMTWPPEGMLMLKKSSIMYDGEYLVDFNLKNLSSDSPTVPSDVATQSYVLDILKKHLDIKFGGLEVNLVGTEPSEVAALRPGSYVITVLTAIENGPTATFAISKSSLGGTPSIARNTNAPGVDTGEELELLWPPNGKLMLRKTGQFYDGDYIIDLGLKNFTNAPPPVLATDVATKEFVLKTIEDEMKAKYEGIPVHLTDDVYSDVIPLKPGSYSINVSPTFDGGPTATFLVSKSSQFGDAQVKKITNSPGTDSGEELMLEWKANEKLKLKKTDAFHDGLYLVDTNLKNFSLVDPPVLPVDTVNKAWVEDAISTKMNEKFQGIKVELVNAVYSDVCPMMPGSYLIAVNPLEPGGPTAVFSVSKSHSENYPEIVKFTSAFGKDTDITVEITWEPFKKLRVRKTGPFFDGTYVVSSFFKNLSATSEIVTFPSDIANKEYVDSKIDQVLSTRFYGVDVNLSGMEPEEVYPLKTGTYMVSVSSVQDGAPTASWVVSKNSLSGSSAIVELVNLAGATGTTLQLSWPPDGKLTIQKSTNDYDGVFTVLFDQRNLEGLPSLLELSSSVKVFLEYRLKEVLEDKLNGLEIILTGTEWQRVDNLKTGAHTVTISPNFEGGPAAIFHMCKSSQAQRPFINRTAATPGNDGIYQTFVEVSWESNDDLFIRKTSNIHDGEYNIQLSRL